MHGRSRKTRDSPVNHRKETQRPYARATLEARVKHPLLFFIDIQTASFPKNIVIGRGRTLRAVNEFSITEKDSFVNQLLVQFCFFLAFFGKI